jgi:flagellar basal body rod protein FlgG
MIKGFYAAASAMIARLNQQKYLSHNIANLNTPGFKGVLTSLEEYLRVSAVQPQASAESSGRLELLGELGLGVETTLELTDFSQGTLKSTGQPLDLAVEGEGFFRVETPAGERFTRDGRFMVNAEGEVVTVDGHYLLDQNNQRITLEEGEIRVDHRGEIFVDGASQAVLELAVFEDPEESLVRDQANLFEASGGLSDQEPGSVQQGYLEMSNIDPAEVMTEMAKVARSYEAAQKMVQSQDELLGKAISSLGRF